jgi:uncharacterized Zn finger protein
MIEAIIAHACASLSAALRRAAGQASSATTLRQIAQAMENVTHGAAIYRAGLVSPVQRNDHGLIIAAVVVGDAGTANVATGIKSEDVRWSCSCAATGAVFNGVCSHIVAVRLAIAVEGAAERQRERAERRRLISDYMMDMGAKKTLLERAQAAERAAQDAYDTARAAYENLIAQVNEDDVQARAELAWSQSSMPTVASLREAA